MELTELKFDLAFKKVGTLFSFTMFTNYVEKNLLSNKVEMGVENLSTLRKGGLKGQSGCGEQHWALLLYIQL